MTVRILTGDCRSVLATLPADSVHCVVTSPPYWGLRDYGIGKDAFGLEPTIDLYVRNAVEIFRAVHRVLRPDGTLWLNLGDSYAGGGGFSPNAPSNLAGSKQTTQGGSKPGGIPTGNGLKPKDLCGIPWRVAFALQADGWWLRQDIIWAKPNPMPESVTDRCTKAHEYLFLLTKSAKYFYDAEAIKEPTLSLDPDHPSYRPNSAVIAANGRKEYSAKHEMSARSYDPAGRNKRSVWTVATSPYPEAHFATFPPELIEPCIKAGCPKDGTVLDPFGGAGTTGLVADRLQRNAILIELNESYAAMAQRRITADAPLLQLPEAAE